MTAKSRYDRLSSDRSQFLNTARQAADLTLPYLIREDEVYTKGSLKLTTPWQSVGAKGVVTLASKLMLALLPPQTSFFKLQVNDASLPIDLGPEVRSELDLSFAKVERIIMEAIAASGDLKNIAAKDTSGIAVFDTTGSFTGNTSIPKVGRADEFIFAAQKSAKLNEIYGPIKTAKGLYFIKLLSRDELDKEKYNTQKTAIRQTLQGQKERMQFYQWWNEEKEKIKTEDQRYRFYRNL